MRKGFGVKIEAGLAYKMAAHLPTPRSLLARLWRVNLCVSNFVAFVFSGEKRGQAGAQTSESG
jgi:hypothetical protein